MNTRKKKRISPKEPSDGVQTKGMSTRSQGVHEPGHTAMEKDTPKHLVGLQSKVPVHNEIAGTIKQDGHSHQDCIKLTHDVSNKESKKNSDKPVELDSGELFASIKEVHSVKAAGSGPSCLTTKSTVRSGFSGDTTLPAAESVALPKKTVDSEPSQLNGDRRSNLRQLSHIDLLDSATTRPEESKSSSRSSSSPSPETSQRFMKVMKAVLKKVAAKRSKSNVNILSETTENKINLNHEQTRWHHTTAVDECSSFCTSFESLLHLPTSSTSIYKNMLDKGNITSDTTSNTSSPSSTERNDISYIVSPSQETCSLGIDRSECVFQNEPRREIHNPGHTLRGSRAQVSGTNDDTNESSLPLPKVIANNMSQADELRKKRPGEKLKQYTNDLIIPRSANIYRFGHHRTNETARNNWSTDFQDTTESLLGAARRRSTFLPTHPQKACSFHGNKQKPAQVHLNSVEKVSSSYISSKVTPVKSKSYYPSQQETRLALLRITQGLSYLLVNYGVETEALNAVQSTLQLLREQSLRMESGRNGKSNHDMKTKPRRAIICGFILGLSTISTLFLIFWICYFNAK